MSDRLCYIRRTDRGIVLRGLRLIGGHTDDSWVVDPGADPELIIETIDEAAEWIRQRLDMSSKADLGALVLDTDGSACTWVKPEDADPSLLESRVNEGPIEHDPDELEPVAQDALSERIPRLPREMDYQPLSEDQTSTGARRAILAIPDVPGRLLKDKLDAMGIRPEKLTSIWHALCIAWDPGLDSSNAASRIVSSDAPISAIVAIDPNDARLIWAWSREGELICAGSSRLRRVHGEHEPRVMIWKSDVARLCADWLGWSSQLGVSPSRVVVLGEPIVPPPEQDSPPAERPYDAAQLGAALTQRWPDATLDLLGEPDPIGATLQRIAQREISGSLSTIQGLEARPTRAHRSMFRWAGLALTAAACVVLLLAWQFMSRANTIKGETRALNAQARTVLSDYDPAMQVTQVRRAVFDLESDLIAIRQRQTPIEIPAPKPILEALETVSYVVGSPGIEVTKVTVNTRTVTVVLVVSEIAQAERVLSSLRSIDDSLLDWRSSLSPSNRGGNIQVSLLADWRDEEAGS